MIMKLTQVATRRGALYHPLAHGGTSIHHSSRASISRIGLAYLEDYRFEKSSRRAKRRSLRKRSRGIFSAGANPNEDRVAQPHVELFAGTSLNNVSDLLVTVFIR